MIKALFSLASELIFFPGCISWLLQWLPWSSGAVWVWRGSVKHQANMLGHGVHSPFECIPLFADFLNLTVNPWADTIRDMTERAETWQAHWNSQFSQTAFGADVTQSKPCCVQGQAAAASASRQTDSWGSGHRAAARYARDVLSWQVLVLRHSAHRGNPMSARAERIWQGESKGEQSLLAASPLLQPALALWFKGPCEHSRFLPSVLLSVSREKYPGDLLKQSKLL